MIHNKRFERPGPNLGFNSEYDIPSAELMDLISRNPATFTTKIIPIGVASGRLEIREPGYGFVMWGFSTIDQSKYSDAYIQVALNSDGSDPSKIFPCKTGRGYRGSFTYLTLIWPQDPFSVTNSAYFVIFKSKKTPFMGGAEAL